MKDTNFKAIDINDFFPRIESLHFRTNEDTGANRNALLIWNLVRKEFGLSELRLESLPAYCVTHNKYHYINSEYGCKRKD